MKNVQQLMSKECVTATTQDELGKVAQLMKQHDIGVIPIVDGKRLVGVVTDRDLAIRGYAENKPATAIVSHVMTSHVTTIPSTASIDEASQMMATNQLRRLLVVDEGMLQGVISLGDLAVRQSSADEAGEALSQISK